MGLDIRVYTKVKLVQEQTEDIECLWEWIEKRKDEVYESQGCEVLPYLTVLHSNENFPNHFNKSGAYSYEESDNIFSRAYSAWSRTRNELAKAVGYDEITYEECEEFGFDYNHANHLPYQYKAWTQNEGILHELLYFSDCEGTICNEYCKKIYEDLKIVDVTKFENNIELNVYYKLLEGFKFAAENEGVVDFS